MASRSSLKRTILTLVLGVATLGLAGGVASYVCISRVIANYSHIAEESFPAAMALADMRGDMRSARLYTLSLGIQGLTKEQIEVNLKGAKDSWDKLQASKKAYQALDISPEERKLIEPAGVVEEKIHALMMKAEKLALSGDPGDYLQLTNFLAGEFTEVGHGYTKVLQPLIDQQGKEAERWQGQAREAAKIGVATIFSLAMASFVIASILGYAFARRLTATFTELTQRLATGAGSVAEASQRISSAGGQLSAATTEQAAALQETVASIDEVSAMVGKNADNAKRSLTVAEGSDQAAARGKEAVEAMLSAIETISRGNDEIMHETEASNREISTIVKVINEIGNKTKVINDIVFQTKLLSFNASVEAARAGEHGKGFAVVAEEVGNLAQMSGNAAKEISQMLDESTQKVERTVNATKGRLDKLISAGKERVESGVVTAKRCGESLDEIVRRVQELNHMVNEIATASDEQAKGVEEITKAMGQLDQVTQQNAAGAQEAARSSELLNGEAATLRQLVGVLEATVHGGHAGTSGGHSSAALQGSTRTSPPAAASRHAAPVAATNVVRLTTRGRTAPVASPAPGRSESLKMAVGSDAIPAEDDPRFEDV